ncbi:MAG: DUF2332 domain-containing protein [Candidatus Dormibacteraceae bacterium]
MTAPGRQAVARRLRDQGRWCHELGSPLYGHLLGEAGRDAEEGGPAWEVLRGHEADPAPSALALRLMGGVHRLVLEGRLPELASGYPSAGGSLDPERSWPAFRRALVSHRAELAELVERPLQTNEVGRCAALLGGFLAVSRACALPLRLLELGCSAGLNLRWDHYRYRAGAQLWGDAASPVYLGDPFEGAAPPLHVRALVAERRGCDIAPLDATTAGGEMTLLSYVWADQTERFQRLRGAIEVARRVPARVDAADAADWLQAVLAPAPGLATIVFHSIAVQYFSADSRVRVRRAVSDAGRMATLSAPVAWLRMEPAPGQYEVRLTLWPGGEERLLATAGAHGRPVRWLALGLGE